MTGELLSRSGRAIRLPVTETSAPLSAGAEAVGSDGKSIESDMGGDMGGGGGGGAVRERHHWLGDGAAGPYGAAVGRAPAVRAAAGQDGRTAAKRFPRLCRRAGRKGSRHQAARHRPTAVKLIIPSWPLYASMLPFD